MQLKALMGQTQQQQALYPGQQQEQAQKVQSGALGLQEQQKQIADQAKIEKLFADAGGDPEAIKAIIPKIMAVNPQMGIQFQKNIMEAQTADIAHKKAVIGYHADIAGRVAQVTGGVKDQDSYQKAVGSLLAEGTIDPQTASQYLSQPYDPAKVAQIQQSALSAKEQLDQADKKLTEAETHRHNVAEENKIPLDQQEATSWLAQNPGKTMADYGKYKAALAPTATFNVNNQSGGGLSSAALDQAAERYASTGVLPSMGMGAAGAASRKAIMNRAGELHPSGSLAANSAEFKANQSSLTKLQSNFDQVTAFENTAGKNLDVFLKAAEDFAPAGSKILNVPWNAANRSLYGGPKIAALDAARTTALTEIAKVLNSSNASGVLSDSARGEVGQLIGKDASLAAIKSAANILKQDMENRHQSYQDQIADIQGRLGKTEGGSQGGGPAASKAAPPSGATHIGIGSADKKKHYLDANGKDLGLAE